MAEGTRRIEIYTSSCKEKGNDALRVDERFIVFTFLQCSFFFSFSLILGGLVIKDVDDETLNNK
jgi:hypothetical protein